MTAWCTTAKHRRLGFFVAALSLATLGFGCGANDELPAAPPSPRVTLPEPGSPFYVDGLGPLDFVLVKTDTITHVADQYGYFDYTREGYVNPDAPTNWLSEVPYADGDFDLRVEVIDLPKDDAELYYTITWTQGTFHDVNGFIRPAVHVESGEGTYTARWLVKDTEHSLDGSFGSRVGDNWTWDSAFHQIGGDLVCYPSAQEECFPGTFRVTLIVRAPAGS
jgi:hypothetical protein